MKKKLFALLGISALVAGGFSALLVRNVKSVKADTTVTVSSNFIYDFNNLTVGTVDGDQRILSDGSTNINDVALSMFNGESLDDGVNLVFNGNNASYAQGNILRNKYDGYLQLRYPSTVDGDGGQLVITPKDASYKITSISISLHSRNFTDSNAGNSYNHIVINGASMYKSISELGLTAENLTYTYNNDAGVTSMAFGISLKQAEVVKNEKYLILGGVSVTYTKSDNFATVSFDSQGGSAVTSQSVELNGYATRPTDPTREPSAGVGYEFDGWHTDPVEDTPFDFENTQITGDITLYAHWQETAVTTYTLTFDTQGGSTMDPQVVEAGQKWTTPADKPTYESDDKYVYTFHNWYQEAECIHKFDFNAVPTADATAYAGFSKKAVVPSGYKQIDPKKNMSTWGPEYAEGFLALDINTHETIDTAKSYPEMNWVASHAEGSSTSGVKYANSEFIVNNTTMSLTIVDSTKYFTGFRIEFYVTTWDATASKQVTLTSGGVECDSGMSPYDSTFHSDLVLIGDCTNKPQEFTFSVARISSAGMRFRYLYATFGTYSAEELAKQYAVNFNAAKVCGDSKDAGLDEAKWLEQKAAYEALTNDAKEYIRDYEGVDVDLVECLERYDRVVLLHGADYDFMGRVAAGHISLANPNIGTNSASNGVMIAVIISVSFVSISLILGLVLVSNSKRRNYHK